MGQLPEVTDDTLSTFGALFRKVLFFCLIGFVFVFLTGPLLAVLSIIVSFAAIGMVVWLPLCLLAGKPSECTKLFDLVKSAWRQTMNAFRWTFSRSERPPLRAAAAVAVEKEPRTGFRFVHLLVEMAAGAVVGGLLGGISSYPSGAQPEAVLLGGLIGGFLGLLVGGSRMRQPQAPGADSPV